MKMPKSPTTTIINPGQSRSVLVIIGIAIAFLCVLTLIGEADSTGIFNTDVPHKIKTSRMIVMDFVGKALMRL